MKPFFELGFAKRPGEELYDLRKDSFNINNVANLAEYASAKKELSGKLLRLMEDEKDPRLVEVMKLIAINLLRGPGSPSGALSL